MTQSNSRKGVAVIRLIIAATIGIIIGITAFSMGAGKLSSMFGWDAGALFLIISIWLTIWPMGHQQTARYAQREDPTRAGADIILLLASVASLASIGFGLSEVNSTTGGIERTFLTLLSIASVVLAWVLVHTIYALRYARLYYSAPESRSVDFLDDKQPSFADFIYFSFTIGMTFQVSDTNIRTTEFRIAVFRHSLLSYLFGTVIVATTVSLIAGLVK